MNYTKQLLSESSKGEPIKVTGLASAVTTHRALITNVATITSAEHGLVTGDYIYLSGMTADVAYNGIHQVTVSSTTKFTFPLVHADEAETADTDGTIQKLTKIHATPSGTDDLDEIWINVVDVAAANGQIALFFGEEEVSDYYTVASRDSKRVIVAGDLLQDSSVIYAYCVTADNYLKITGYINRESN